MFGSGILEKTEPTLLTSIFVISSKYTLFKFKHALNAVDSIDITFAGIIILVDTKRTLSKDEKRYQAIVNQKSIDVFTGKKLSLGEIESGLTANSHVEAHSKGGSKMVVGNSKANLKSKTDTIYNAL